MHAEVNMAAKARADRSALATGEPAMLPLLAVGGPDASRLTAGNQAPAPEGPAEGALSGDAKLVDDADLEGEVQAVAAWFDGLPLLWQRYFDEEARNGRRAYGPS